MPCLTSGRPEVQGSMILLNGINVPNSQRGEISQGPDTTVQDRSNGGLDWNGDRGKKEKKKKEGKKIIEKVNGIWKHRAKRENPWS